MGKTLKEIIDEKSGWRRVEEIARIYEKAAEGKIRLIDPRPPNSLVEYMTRLDYTLWFYTAFSITIITVAVVLLSPLYPILYPLRYIFGPIFVAFLPGYALVEALYPRSWQISDLEKLAGSIALSLAVTPLTGLLLNYTRGGITLNRLILLNTILIIATLLVALVRKYKYSLSTVGKARSFELQR